MRKRRTTTRKRGMRGDWVYRPAISDDNNLYTSYGGWMGSTDTFDITNSVEDAATLVLYDSHDFMAAVTNLSVFDDGLTGAQFPTALPGVARIEGVRMPTALAVDGAVYMRPTAWTLGTRFCAKARLGWHEQDQTIGQILIDPLWSIWDPSGANPAEQANIRPSHIHEWTFASACRDNDSTPTFIWHMKWRGRIRAPSSNHMLCIWIEAPGNTLLSNATMRCVSQVRAKMAGPTT